MFSVQRDPTSYWFYYIVLSVNGVDVRVSEPIHKKSLNRVLQEFLVTCTVIDAQRRAYAAQKELVFV